MTDRSASTIANRGFTRAEIEDFLYMEAELLDSWKLKEWLDLFTQDARYLVPSTDLDAAASPDHSLFFIADDRHRLSERVARLMKKTAFSEFPRSKTRHIVGNVRIADVQGEECTVKAAFLTYRGKRGVADTYIGTSEYRLVRSPEGLRIREKRCVLDLETLRPHGRISIIL
jgi:p-cumate 2,3-dioxygenase beta subunit